MLYCRKMQGKRRAMYRKMLQWHCKTTALLPQLKYSTGKPVLFDQIKYRWFSTDMLICFPKATVSMIKSPLTCLYLSHQSPSPVIHEQVEQLPEQLLQPEPSESNVCRLGSTQCMVA